MEELTFLLDLFILMYILSFEVPYYALSKHSFFSNQN